MNSVVKPKEMCKLTKKSCVKKKELISLDIKKKSNISTVKKLKNWQKSVLI